MPEATHPILVFTLALAAGVVSQVAARHLRIPGIVLLLAVGVGLGPDGLGWVRPDDLGEALFGIVHLTVAVILFEGGLNLELGRIRRSRGPIRSLVTTGALITMFGGMAAAYFLLGWNWETSLLFGSLIVVTGPTVITPLVSELRLRPRVGTVLEAEGVMIDPIGVLLAALALDLALSPGFDSLAEGALALGAGVAFGGLAGAAAGFALRSLLGVRWLFPEGLANIMTLGSVLLLFEICESLVPESGILAVTVAGAVVGTRDSEVARDLRDFKDQLTVMGIGLLFVLLAAGVAFDDIRALGWQGFAVVGLLIAVVRPLNVFLCTLGSNLEWRERAFVAWIAPRGIVAAAIASITAVRMDQEGIPGGDAMRALVFLTISVTVLMAGLTGRPVASLLKLRLPGRTGTAILGAQGLSLALAKKLRSAGSTVVLLDSNPQNCRKAEEAGLSVVFGNGLEERVMQRARFESIGIAIGMTPNEALNDRFVQQARDSFRVPVAYVALTHTNAGVTPELLERKDVRLLFARPVDVERWDVRSRHGEIEVVDYEIGEAVESDDAAAAAEKAEKIVFKTAEPFVPLTRTRERKIVPIMDGLKLQPGDVITVAVHVPERELVDAELAQRGWKPVLEPTE